MGLPILSIDPPKSTPFVAVEFDTYQNLGWDPPSITPGTHLQQEVRTRNILSNHGRSIRVCKSVCQAVLPSPSPSPSPSTNPSPTPKSNPSTSPSPSSSPSTNPSPTPKSNPSTSPSPSPSSSPSTNPSPTAKSSPSTNSSPSPNAVNSGIGKKTSGGIDYQIIFFGWLVGFAWLYIVGK
ncbi:putative uncharacterized protein DDB_G0290521 [Camellia sinensis]|uniref:putative uncharacterized protein DDB_G0290521 n=1 Tax=Camellia sinensis TaxID=4442 RepID=UPI001035B5C8|nr:putative uncharacterized protein DDB_G0290521 [Camellia sinensis]